MPRTGGEESKKRLFNAAEILFAQKGIKATTISEIVKSAGLSQAAFYLYFKSKDELLSQMIEKFESELMDLAQLGKRVRKFKATDIEDYLSEFYAQVFKLLGENANLMKVSFQFVDENEVIRKKLVDQIIGNMKINQSFGIVKKEVDIPIAAEMIVATIERLVYRFILTEEKTPEELGKQMAKIILYGTLNKS